MDTESKEFDPLAIKQGALQEATMRTIKITVPSEMAHHIQNAIIRGRFFMTISYSNNQETMLYHRYCRKNFNLDFCLQAIEEVEKELLAEYSKESSDVSNR